MNSKNSNPRFRSPIQRMFALWMMRVFARPMNFKHLVTDLGYTNEEIAEFLGLPEYAPGFSSNKAHEQLRSMLNKLERLNYGLPPALDANMTQIGRILKLNKEEVAVMLFFASERESQFISDMINMLKRKGSLNILDIISPALAMPRSKVSAALSRKGRLLDCGLLKIDGMNGEMEFHSRSLANRLFSKGFGIQDILDSAGVILTANSELTLKDFDSVQEDLEILVPYLKKALKQRKVGVNILVYGMPGTGKTQLSRVLASETGVGAYEFSPTDADGDGMTAFFRLLGLKVAQSFLTPGSAIMVFDEMEDVIQSSPWKKAEADKMKGWFNKLLEENPNPVIWISNSINRLDPAFCRRFDYIMELPMPGRAQRTKLLNRKAGNLISQATMEKLADVKALAPAVIDRAASVIAGITTNLPAAKRDAAFVRVVSGVLSAQGHGELKMGPPSILDPDIYSVHHLNTETNLEAIAEGLRRRPSGRLCLYGPPGTGKTAFGHWLAREIDRPLLLKRASDLLAPFVGETEANLAKAFKSAKQEGAVLMIDEMDSFLQSREVAQRSWEVTQVNEMLTQIEAFEGVLIGSTNLMNRMDSASMRRFDLKIHFDYLTAEQTLNLFSNYCKAMEMDGPTEKIMTQINTWKHATPGDFAAVARRHRFQPYSDTDAFAAALSEEMAIKSGVARRIGFAAIA